MSPYGACVQAGTRTRSTDRLNISCCYLLFTDQLETNPYIIPLKLICGLFIAIITHIFNIPGVCAIV